MNCKLYRDLLGLYVGGDLERDEDIAVRAHVGVCTECAREVEDYRTALTALATAKPDEPAPPLWDGVAAAIAPEKNDARPAGVVAFRGLAWLSCAAALFMGLAAGLVVQMLLTRTPPPAERAPEVSHVEKTPGTRGPSNVATPQPEPVGTSGGGLINDFITFLTGPGGDATPKKKKAPGRDILNPDGSYHLQQVDIVPPGPRRVRF